jgi:hypothetical protein
MPLILEKQNSEDTMKKVVCSNGSSLFKSWTLYNLIKALETFVSHLYCCPLSLIQGSFVPVSNNYKNHRISYTKNGLFTL